MKVGSRALAVDTRGQVAAAWDHAPVAEVGIAAPAAVAAVASEAAEGRAVLVADPAEAGHGDVVIASSRGAGYAAFASTKLSILITRMLHACASTSLSVPRSSHAARPVLVLDISVP